MQKYLALFAAIPAAVCHAQASPPGRPAAELRQVIVQKAVPAQSFTPRQLSVEERAELRRQLAQYSRVAGKGS